MRNPRNLGSAANHNKVFSLARGRYFRWAASDDFVSAGVLSRCVRALEEDSTRILAFPQTVLVDARGKTLRPYDDGDGWSAATAAERFEVSLTQWGYCDVMYGVVRADMLRKTRLLGSYPGSDFVLQADLAVRGAFTRVRGEYYHRRIHDGCTNERDPEQLPRFFVPERNTPFDWKLLRIFCGLTGAVWDAPISIGQKRRMYGALARRAFWARDSLSAEATWSWRASGKGERQSNRPSGRLARLPRPADATMSDTFGSNVAIVLRFDRETWMDTHGVRRLGLGPLLAHVACEPVSLLCDARLV